MPREKAKTQNESEDILIDPLWFATAPNQTQSFTREQNDKNQAESLRADTVRKRAKKCVASLGQG